MFTFKKWGKKRGRLSRYVCYVLAKSGGNRRNGIEREKSKMEMEEGVEVLVEMDMVEEEMEMVVAVVVMPTP